jgi:hypothetical protein
MNGRGHHLPPPPFWRTRYYEATRSKPGRGRCGIGSGGAGADPAPDGRAGALPGLDPTSRPLAAGGDGRGTPGSENDNPHCLTGTAQGGVQRREWQHAAPRQLEISGVVDGQALGFG